MTKNEVTRLGSEALLLIFLVIVSIAIVLILTFIESLNQVLLLKALGGSVVASGIIAYRLSRRRNKGQSEPDNPGK